MALACDGTGRIEVDDILTQVNLNESNIVLVANAVNANVAEINTNTAAIADHETRIAAIEGSGGSLPALELRVGNLEADMTDAQNDIVTNAGDIVTIAGALATVEADTLQNTNDIVALYAQDAAMQLTLNDVVMDTEVLSPTSATNFIVTQDDIENELNKFTTDVIDPAINKIVTQNNQVFVRSRQTTIMHHFEATGISGGNSTAGAWEMRTMNTFMPNENYLGLVLTANQFTLVPGRYSIEGFASANGAYHQARVQDLTNAVTLALGSSQDEGSSMFAGIFDVVANIIVRLESQVDVSTVDGYGKPNPFDVGSFSRIKIDRLGDV